MSRVLVILLVIAVAYSNAFAGPDKKAKKAYEAQDFEQAARILVEKLMKKNKHQDNINLMERSLENAFKKGIREAEEAERRGNLDNAVAIYRRLKQLGDEVTFLEVIKEMKIDGKKKKVPYTFEVPDISAKLHELESGAVETHYVKAVQLMEAGSWKEAAVSFRHAREYDQNYKDAAARYAECREKATLRIAVMPFENLSGKTEYGAIEAQITEQIVSSAINAQPEFLQFVTRDYINQLLAEQGMQQSEIMDQATATQLGKKLGVHAFVFGKILSAIKNYPADEVHQGENRVTITTNKGEYPAYAQWWKHTLKGTVEINASYQIVGVETGTIMAAEQESGSAFEQRRWVEFKGDEAALPKKVQAHQIEGKGSISPPEVLLQKAMSSLSSNLASKLVAFFN